MQAQQFSITSLPLVKSDTLYQYTIPVSGLPGTCDTTGFGLQSVTVDIIHPESAALTLVLTNPAGQYVILKRATQATGADMYQTVFTCTASQPVYTAFAPYTGNYLPVESIGYLNTGGNPNGSWRIGFIDSSATIQGVVNEVTLNFGSNPCTWYLPHTFYLPLIRLETGGEPVQKKANTRGTAHVYEVRDNDTVLNCVSPVKVSLHGTSSLFFAQPSFNITSCDTADNKQSISPLGMPAENEWILLAPYSEKTLIRNALAFELYRVSGYYTPRYRFCELILNNKYYGIYLLVEKIKIDANRVNIPKLDSNDTHPSTISGGYFFEYDWDTAHTFYTSLLPCANGTGFAKFNLLKPDQNDFNAAQQHYITGLLSETEDHIRHNRYTTLRSSLDTRSVIYFSLLQELGKNADAYRASIYFYKPHNRPLVMGPPWDFNMAFDATAFCSAASASGWAFNDNACHCNLPYIWPLYQHTDFRKELRHTYHILRCGEWGNNHISALTDSLLNIVAPCVNRHYAHAWPILPYYTWPDHSPLPLTYTAQVSRLKTWLSQRLEWLDAEFELPNCAVFDNATLFPNPTGGQLTLYLNDTEMQSYTVTVYDATGKTVQSFLANPVYEQQQAVVQFSLEQLRAGLYLVSVYSAARVHTFRVVKQ